MPEPSQRIAAGDAEFDVAVKRSKPSAGPLEDGLRRVDDASTRRENDDTRQLGRWENEGGAVEPQWAVRVSDTR
jgi:hypothetical protein